MGSPSGTAGGAVSASSDSDTVGAPPPGWSANAASPPSEGSSWSSSSTSPRSRRRSAASVKPCGERRGLGRRLGEQLAHSRTGLGEADVSERPAGEPLRQLGVERREGREEARVALGTLGVQRAPDRQLEGAVVGADRCRDTLGCGRVDERLERGESTPSSSATSVSIPSGDRYASAKRLAGSSSRNSPAVSCSESGREPSAPVATSTMRRTPTVVPITRNSSTLAVARPRESVEIWMSR